MTADVLKRLFKAIYSEDIQSLKKLTNIIIQSERKKGHNVLANSLEKITMDNSLRKRQISRDVFLKDDMSTLPRSRRNNRKLVSFIQRSELKHHMVLQPDIEERLLSIEKEYAARERLANHNLFPKRKILIYGPPGCGKTLSAERIAWNLGLPLLKVRFDSLISSYFGESSSNLRDVFDYCKKEPVVLLLDECDFIAKSRIAGQDVGEAPRIVNMLLMLLDEYNATGLVIATTNLKISLDEALFRRFDAVIEMPMPTQIEIKKLLKMTLSAMNVSDNVNWDEFTNRLNNHSAASVVAIAQNAAKNCVLEGSKLIQNKHIEKALKEISMQF